MNTIPTFREKRTGRIGFFDKRRNKDRSLYFFYTAQLSDFQEVLKTTKDILHQEQIWPDQLEYLIHRVKSFQKTAGGIANLANSTKRHDDKQTDFSRYTVIVSAEYFSEHTGTLLALMPKCPMRLAAYVAIGTGLTLSYSSAHPLMRVLTLLSISTLAFCLVRRIIRHLRTTKSPHVQITNTYL